ncbi:MAG: N-acetylmuramoyl-L-alanine amidase [Anaerovoracaceae bacterium]|jgi:N-acetylmuramoyl-L-alanine amidase
MKKGKKKNRFICAILSVCVSLAMIPTFAFAEETAQPSEAGQSQSQEVQQPAEQNSGTQQAEQPAQEEEAAAGSSAKPKTAKEVTETNYTVKATRTGKLKYRWPGYVTSIRSGKTTSLTKTYTKATTFKITPYDGFSIYDVIVDGKSVGKVSSYTFEEGTTGSHTIYAKFRRTGVFILIDPGHAGYCNRGYYSYFYESERMWKEANYLRYYLDKYPGVVVGMTKKSLYDDPSVYGRGAMAKGYDLFISCHTNESTSKYSDYPLAIVSYAKARRAVAGPLGKDLAKTMKSTMKTRQSYQVWVKRQSDGRDWFGVIRGSGDVNVPGMILEHSFHSNPRACKWMHYNSNLKKLARNESKVIASHYGVSSTGQVTAPATPTGFNAVGKRYRKARVTWYQVAGASGYQLYRADSKYGKYKRIKTTSANSYYDYSLETTSYYKVRAYRNLTNGKRLYSSFTSPNCAKYFY